MVEGILLVVDSVEGPMPQTRFVLKRTLEFGHACDFQVIYANAKKEKAGLSPENLVDDLGPLFECIMRCIPGPRIDKDGSLQMLVSIWAYSNWALGSWSFTKRDGNWRIANNTSLIVQKGCRLVIYVPCGISDIQIGETIADKVTRKALSSIKVEEPTVKMIFAVNT
ncbi:hypothetical protein TSUD_244520 [Trifolium subterraneum]|uniref:Uncharacterized protein n=1 Tax=Trifolium subterraneum TaxID=3900 RepID=A0A2Z6PJ43_TRISU|nr:hypothetical protein TSUD_244520 [Trifolium subterraneum]